jgi:hypothetical protein
MKSSVLNRNLADLPVRPGSPVGAEERRPLRRQTDDHHFGSL